MGDRMKMNVYIVAVTLALLANLLCPMFNPTSTVHGFMVINVPDDYPTIQEAVNAANPGDTIIVSSGIYYEHITISKNHLTLLGENPSSTIIDGNGIGPIIYLPANDTTIMGFTIRNSGEEEDTGKPGLYIKFACCNTLANNIFYNCWIGIEVEGNMSYNSWSNKIIGNTLIDNEKGILLTKFSVANIVSGNTVTKSVEGIYLTAYSSNNTINENTVTNNDCGICLSHSTGNTISGNILTQNDYGISMSGTLSTRNIIRYNVIANSEYGIQALYPSNSNIVYLNNFIQNTNQVSFGTSMSIFFWDNGFEGNYWDDYNGTDTNGDGIGETPYVINEKNQDNYPFMKKWGWDTVKPSVTIISPTSGIQIKSTTVLAAWIGLDDISGIDHYEIQLDDNSWTNVGMSVTYTFTEVRDGSHTIKAKAVDKAGNSDIASISFFVINTSSIEGPSYTKEAILLAVGVMVVAGIAIYLLKIKKKA